MRVIIMCKAPVPGRVKTRLMSGFSPEEAASIHAAMATTVIERARRLFADGVEVAADDPLHPFFCRMQLPVKTQPKGDLGERMAHLVSVAFQEGEDAVMLLGTDSPHMADGRLLAAARALNEYDAVVGPVEDGGYDLIAMRAPHLELFRGIDWSTERVLSQTCAIASGMRLSLRELPVCFDVDTPATLRRAQQAGWLLPKGLLGMESSEEAV